MKRQQVFISSTYEDLKKEREELIKALMKADYIPSSMEFFGATHSTSWDKIKEEIDNSDIFVLLIGSRYGSSTPGERISYTQKEYEYAMSKGDNILPTLVFIQTDTNGKDLSSKACEREKLQEFIGILKRNKNVDSWKNSDELAGKVISAVSKEVARTPALSGWYRFPNPPARVNANNKDDFFISISANQRATLESMRTGMEKATGIAITDKNSIYIDILSELNITNGIILPDHVAPIKQIFRNLSNYNRGQHIHVALYMPTMLAAHFGCEFANTGKIEIYQSTNDIYSSFGIISKNS
jgi:hypothetical protein